MAKQDQPNKATRGVTLNELVRLLEQRRKENPEAARLRERMAELSMRLSVLEAIRFDGWLTQAQAAQWLNVHRGTINRAVKAGKIITNGESGNECLLHPASVADFYADFEERSVRRLERDSK